jgi:hypothetical protein
VVERPGTVGQQQAGQGHWGGYTNQHW